MPGETPERMYDLASAHNFRDMGGYPTRDGRQTRWQTIFRSGVMSRVAGEDAERLRSLGITTICDFRTNSERSRKPTVWHRDTPAELIERDHEVSAGALRELLKRGEVGADHVADLMRSIYRDLPFEQVPSYRNLFLRLAAGHVPLVFNCSAGKDRTGIAAALLLDLLGVDRKTILEDYLLTNAYIPQLAQLSEQEADYGNLVRSKPEIALPLLRAEPHYLQAMFESIEERAGSARRFVIDYLDLSESQIAAIGTVLLEPLTQTT